jgi:tetratricopeptide (TPR) repeat protein
VEATVGLVAVAPTILAAAGIEVPAAMVGRSLFAARDRGDSGIYAETYTPRFHFGWSELVSWIRGPHQYIHGPDPELFDLGSDPAQTHNLIAEERRLAHDLRSILERQLSPPEPPAAVDEEARAALAALGYAGGVSSRRLGSSRELPDPKRMVHTLRDLHAGLEQYAAGRPQEAAATLRRAVTASPDLVDAWDYLGRSYQRLRQFDRAIAAFREALDRSERAPEAAIGAAISLVEVGRPTEALLVVRAERQRDPHDLRLGLLEGRLLLSLGRTVEAERLAQETLQQGPDDADALYQMGAVKMATRDLVEAEQYFRRALAIAPEHPAASSDLDVLIRAQRIAGSGSR